ncbi:unnamed protein product, partial [Staurois parvus]
MMSQVTSCLLLLHVITDWPISDHMIGTSHRGPVPMIGVQLCPEERAQAGCGEAVYKRPPDLHCHRPAGPFIYNSQTGSVENWPGQEGD